MTRRKGQNINLWTRRDGRDRLRKQIYIFGQGYVRVYTKYQVPSKTFKQKVDAVLRVSKNFLKDLYNPFHARQSKDSQATLLAGCMDLKDGQGKKITSVSPTKQRNFTRTYSISFNGRKVSACEPTYSRTEENYEQ